MEAQTLPRSIFKPTSVKNHIGRRFSTDFPLIFHKIVSNNDWRIDRELRREVASKLTSINPAMLPESWFYLSKNTLFVMSAKKQTRQSNAKSRRNQHRKHHRKATCAEHVDATVSPPVLVPENHEKCHFLHPDGLILGPDRSTWLIFASKLALQGRSGLDRASNGPTRIDQDRPRSLPGSILGRYGAPRVDPGRSESEGPQAQ